MTSIGLPEARTVVNVLVTGSREFWHRPTIRVAFEAIVAATLWTRPGPYRFRLIEGECPLRPVKLDLPDDELRRLGHDPDLYGRTVQASADLIAASVAHEMGWEIVESAPGVRGFPADWDAYGKSAGHIRNAEMVKYLLAQPGEQVCVGFPMDGLDVPYEGPLPDKGGTWDCLKRARDVGVRTWWAYPGMGAEPEVAA